MYISEWENILLEQASKKQKVTKPSQKLKPKAPKKANKKGETQLSPQTSGVNPTAS